jgi:hypothetical protein
MVLHTPMHVNSLLIHPAGRATQRVERNTHEEVLLGDTSELVLVRHSDIDEMG